MSSKMKISQKTSEQLDYLADALKIRRNIICRMALAASLDQNDAPSTMFEDSSGQEFNKPTILGTDEPLFVALVTQHYGKRIPDDEMFSTYMRAEISNGIGILYTLYRRVNSPVQFFETLCNHSNGNEIVLN